jgi:benzoyl-CoA reductase subunit C
MDELQYFKEMASELYNSEVRAWKEAGGRVVGTVCSNMPEEILHAAELLPLRLRAPRLQDTSNADAQLHRINCSYTRAVLEALMRGDLPFLDGLISTNTCDHMLRLAGELESKAKCPVHYFSMFHTRTRASGEWFVLEMEKLIRHIEEAFSTKISDQKLRQSISVYNRTRQLMAQLDELRKKDPPALSGAEYLQIVLTGMSIPREQFNDKLEAALPVLAGRSSGDAGRPRLMVIGGACDIPEFIEFIEEKGATIVADGLCFGSRHYAGEIDEDAAELLPAIAARYVDKAACPSIIDAFDHSYETVKQTIGDWGIRGVVCARLKFCDHWGGRRKLLAEKLREEGIPLLDLEREYSTAGSGQIATRVQAFLEML